MEEKEIIEKILKVLTKSREPLTTTEIVNAIGLPRYIVMRRLFKLAASGRIRGKQARNRGSWIWWLEGSYNV